MKKVLIIGETAASLKLLKKHLASLGYTVVGAVTNGRDAVNTARESRPDVILMDIDIPGEFGGAQAASQIARELDIPVIVIADQADDEVIAKARDAGARGFLLKPVEPRQLKAAVEIAVGSTGTQTEFTDRFHDLIENTNDLVYITDGKGNIRYANNRVSESLGYAYQDIIGKSFKDLVNPRLFKDASEIFSRQLKGEDVGAFEIELVDRDGVIKTIETRETLKWEKGRIVEVYGIGRDITIRKHAEEALRREKDSVRQYLNIAGVMILVLDTSGTVTLINKRGCEILGYTEDEILGKNWFDNFLPEKAKKEVKNVFSHITAGKPEHYEYQEGIVLCRDGSEKFIAWHNTTVTDKKGMIIGTLSSGEDITERRRAEEELRNQFHFLQSLIDSIPTPIFYKDAEGHYLGCNTSFAHYLGMTKDEIIGRTVYDISPKELADVYYQKDRELFDNPGVQSYETQVHHNDGTSHYVVFNKAVFRDRSGDLGGLVGIIMDVTDLKRIEAALMESEEKFRFMVENINDAVMNLDMNGTIIYIGPAIQAISGYHPDEVIGKNFAEFVHPDDLTGLITSFERSLKQIDEEAEFRIITKNGPYRYVRSSSNAIVKDGLVVGLIGALTDIDWRKKAEDALRESEEKYRDIFESAIEGIYQTTPEGRFISVNPSFAQILGFDTPEDLINATTDISNQFYVDPNRRMELQDLLSRYGKINNFEGQLYRKDGSTVWVTTDAKAVTDESGTARLYQGVILDINKRKNAEEALRQSEEKFRSLFDTSRDVVYISTAEGRFIDINPAAELTFGYSREELLTINVRDLYKDPGQREQFKSAVAKRGFVKDYEVQMKRKDGTIIDCLITGTVRRDPEGAIVGYQGIIRDITERLRLRRQVIQTEKLSSLGAMISGVAHEINNPLTSIIGNAQLLMRKDIPPEFRTKLEVIKRESVRCTKIVAGLLSFAREHRPERCMTDVNAVVVESLRLKEYDLKVNNVRVVTNLPGDLPHTSADPYQLQQVFINLINNSHDALREKGGGRLSIRSFLKDSSICVVFADNGPGIEPADLSRIFDPFFTTKEVGKGTGLGLSIAYGIINEHGGTIDVESRPGKGAEFAVRIPFIESPSTEDSPDRID